MESDDAGLAVARGIPSLVGPATLQPAGEGAGRALDTATVFASDAPSPAARVSFAPADQLSTTAPLLSPVAASTSSGQRNISDGSRVEEDSGWMGVDGWESNRWLAVSTSANHEAEIVASMATSAVLQKALRADPTRFPGGCPPPSVATGRHRHSDDHHNGNCRSPPTNFADSFIVARTIAEYMSSVDLGLYFVCLSDTFRHAAEAELRSRIRSRHTRWSTSGTTAADAPLNASSLDGGAAGAKSGRGGPPLPAVYHQRPGSSITPSVVVLELSDGICVTFSPSTRSIFYHLTHRQPYLPSGLIHGVLSGPLVREIVTLPHRHRTAKGLFNPDIQEDDVGARVTSAARSRRGGGVAVALAALPRHMDQERSHVTLIEGLWLPVDPDWAQPSSFSSMTAAAARPLSGSTSSPTNSSNRGSASSRRQGSKHRLLSAASVISDPTVATLRKKANRLSAARPFFPYLFDVLITFLRGETQLRISSITPTCVDVSYALSLPTPPSRNLHQIGTGHGFACRVKAITAATGEAVADWECELAAHRGGRRSFVALKGAAVVAYAHLQKPVVGAAQKLRTTVSLAVLHAGGGTKGGGGGGVGISAPLLPTIVPRFSVAIFVDGLSLPLGHVEGVALNTPLADLRVSVRTSPALAWAVPLFESCEIRVFTRRQVMDGMGTHVSGGASTGALSPRSERGRESQHSISRRSSARSQRVGSAMSLAGPSPTIAPELNNEDGMLVVDALPPVRSAAFLQLSLEGYQRSAGGWLLRDVKLAQDCALCLLLTPRRSLASIAAAVSSSATLNLQGAATISPSAAAAVGNSSLTVDGALQGGGGIAARVRHLRAQKAREALKDVHPALQMYFVALGAALDACRRGDVPLLVQILDGKVSSSSGAAAVSPRNGGFATSVANVAKAALGSVRLPSDLPALSPKDATAALLVHTAAENGRKQALELLIRRGFPVNRPDSDGQLPLHRCAAKGHAECIPVLLRAPTSNGGGSGLIDAVDHRGRTALHHALEARFLNTALWLVEQGADPNLRDASGRSPCDAASLQLTDLTTLCRRGDVENVRLLMLGAVPATEDVLSNDAACAAWYQESLKHRLTGGRLLYGLRAHWSIHSRTGSTVPNRVGLSALHEAVLAGHVHLVRMLLQSPLKALLDLEERTSAGDSVLHLAAKSACSMELFPLVLESWETANRRPATDALLAVNAKLETPLHTCLKRSTRAGAAVLVHVLSRCQVSPAKYPLEAFGYLVLRALDAEGSSVCHLAVERAKYLPQGVVQALLAAALSAASSVPTPQDESPAARVVRGAAGPEAPLAVGGGGGNHLQPVPTVAQRFAARFPHKALAQKSPAAAAANRGSRSPSRYVASSCPSIFHVAVRTGDVSVMTFMIEFLIHCIRQDIAWPIAELGSLASPGLLRLAYELDNMTMFRKLLALQDEYGLEGRIRPFVVLDVTCLAHRRNADGEVELVRVPLAWRILADARNHAWVDEAFRTPVLLDSLRKSDHTHFELNTLNRTEVAAATLSDLVDEIVTTKDEYQRRRCGARPPPPKPLLTTWGQFLVKPREPTKEELQAKWSHEQRFHDHRLHHLQREGVLLYALSQLLLLTKPSALSRPTATERNLYHRRVLYAAVRCCGHERAFSVLCTELEGTHVMAHHDLVAATNLGVNYSLTPSAGVSFQSLKPDGRMFTPGTSQKPTRAGASDGEVANRLLLSRGQVLSRGSSRPNTRGGLLDGAAVTSDEPTDSMMHLFDESRYEHRMRQQELQLCTLIPHVAVVHPGALLHDLCSRRCFGAAMTLLVTATANAFHAVRSQQQSRNDEPQSQHAQHHQPSSRRQQQQQRAVGQAPSSSSTATGHATATVRGPIEYRLENVNLRCPVVEARSGVTALHLAAQFGVAQLVHRLLRTGQFDAREVSGVRYWSPMHWAARYGHVDTCRLLLNLGVAPTDVSDPTGSGAVLGTTPLHLAAVSGSSELVRLLLDHHSPVDARTGMGRTPLHLAARCGCIDVAYPLVDAGAKVDREDVDGYSPLLLAAAAGHGAFVTQLVSFLRKDALLLSCNPLNGVNMLHLSSWLGSSTSMISLLAQALQQAQIAAAKAQATPGGALTAVKRVASGERTRPASSTVSEVLREVRGPVLRASLLSLSKPSSALRLPVSPCDDFDRASRNDGNRGTLTTTSSPSSTTSIMSSLLQLGIACPYVEALTGNAFVQSQQPPTLSSAAEADALSRPSTARLNSAGAQRPAGNKEPPFAFGYSSARSSRLGVAALERSVQWTITSGPSATVTATASPTLSQRNLAALQVSTTTKEGMATVLRSLPQRHAPPRSSSIRVTPPFGGSLDVLQSLVDATESHRVEQQNPELCRHVHQAVLVASRQGNASLELPESFTKVHVGRVMDIADDDVPHAAFVPDRRGAHPWLPLHYALANGMKDAARIIKEALGKSLIERTPDVTLDAQEDEQVLAQQKQERHDSKRALRGAIAFPVVEGPPLSAHVLSSSRLLFNAIFEPLPPAPPPPKRWWVGYYGRSEGGIMGNVSTCVERAVRDVPTAKSFFELSRLRVMASLAWMVSKPLSNELLYRYLPLLPNVDEPVDVRTGLTLLMIAARLNHVNVAQQLLDSGADPNRRAWLCGESDRSPTCGVTPILIASSSGCLRMVETLIAHEADVDVHDECGNTPVHHAVLRRSFEMLKALLHAGAQIQVENHSGDTPEDVAVALRIHDLSRMLRWWSMTFSIDAKDRTPHRVLCRTEREFAGWVEESKVFYKRLDLLHDDNRRMIANKVEKDSVPALMYMRLCHRMKVHAARSVIAALIPHWWPEDVHELRLQGVFLDDAALAALLTFVKLLTHLEELELSDCKLTDAAMPLLFNACVEHPHIRRLNLNGNRSIGRLGAQVLLDLATDNTNIVGIDLQATGIEPPHVMLIQRQYDQNKKDQALLTQDPTKVPPPPSRHKPYHLPRISAAPSPVEHLFFHSHTSSLGGAADQRSSPPRERRMICKSPVRSKSPPPPSVAAAVAAALS